MPGHTEAQQLAARISDYLVRALHNPSMVRRYPGEFQAIVTAWSLLSRMLPGIPEITAEDLRHFLATAAATKLRPNMTGSTAAQGGSPLSPPKLTGNSSEDMDRYQEQMTKYSRMMDMLSKILDANHEMQRAIIANMRV